MDVMNIGEAIRSLRKKRNIKQQELANKIKISQSYLSLLEKGEREPNLDLINKIADYLMVPRKLILLMACEENIKIRRFEKPLKNIIAAVDEILQAV